MNNIWINALVSTFIVSVVSFSGALFLSLNKKRLQKLVFVLVSFAVGALLGNAFFILIPESQELLANNLQVGLLVIVGIVIMFIIEKLIHWRHNHNIEDVKHEAPLGYISLFTDGLHNFIDGILIASSWMVSPEIGVATTLAVIAHEVPQEISDFGILIHAGFSRKKALLFNFLAACTAILGALITLLTGTYLSDISTYILPVAAGGFVYLAGSDLLPELQREKSKQKSLLQLMAIVAGLALLFFIQINTGHTHDTSGDCHNENHHHHHHEH